MSTSQYLLWREDRCWLFGERVGDRLVSRKQFHFEQGEEAILDEEGDRAIFWSNTSVRMVLGLVAGASRVVVLWRASETKTQETYVRCAHLAEGVLFLGGCAYTGRSATPKAILLFGDLDAETLLWNSLVVPSEVRAKIGEQGPHAFVQDGAMLYVLDSTFPPRWLHAFSIANPRTPVWKGYGLLPSVNSSRSLVLGEQWMAVLSEGFSTDALQEFLSLVFFERNALHGLLERPAESLVPYCVLHATTGTQRMDLGVHLHCYDLAVDGNTLWLAAGNDGVGVVLLEKQEESNENNASKKTLSPALAWERFSWITVPEGNVERVRVISPGIVLAECVRATGERRAVFVHQRERRSRFEK